MTADEGRQEIVNWLEQRGHSSDQIEQILRRLDDYDAGAVRASIFDSVDAGDFDIEAIIREVTQTDKPPSDESGEG